jgi:hypothetical protein
MGVLRPGYRRARRQRRANPTTDGAAPQRVSCHTRRGAARTWRSGSRRWTDAGRRGQRDPAAA